jgi:hypothetical protein
MADSVGGAAWLIQWVVVVWLIQWVVVVWGQVLECGVLRASLPGQRVAERAHGRVRETARPA